MTNSDELVTVGRVGRPHGLGGAFFVEDASEDPERLAPGAELLVGGTPARVVEAKRAAKGRLVIRLDRTVERGAELAVPSAMLPELEPGSFYAFELVGLDVEEDGGGRLGRVERVESGVANDILELDSGLALPLVAACVLEVDRDARRIVIARGFADPG